MYDVVALGELLIDFTPYQLDNQHRVFEQNPGGAPANVLCALSKLGLRTGFIGKVGQDMHGAFLRNVLQENGICVDGLIEDPDVYTTLAFVEMTSGGDRRFSFSRKPGADTCLTKDEVNYDLISAARVLHFGSLSMTNEPARSATIAALDFARSAGAWISYDPNYRAPLWKSEDVAVKQMRSVLDKVDLMKLSSEETMLLTDKTNAVDASQALIDQGIACVIVTLDADGALIRTREGYRILPARSVSVVDATGAGDAFWGGFLYSLLTSGKSPHTLTLDEGEVCTRFANLVASFCVQRRGAIPAMPTLAEINEMMS